MEENEFSKIKSEGEEEEKVTILAALEHCHRTVDLAASELEKLGTLLIGDETETPNSNGMEKPMTKSIANVYSYSIDLADKLFKLKTKISTLREVVK